MARRPFVILTGFLGAGKTTLLNRVLAVGAGRRLAVIVNDLGRVDVDRRLLAAHAGDMLELSSGCVCCQLDVNRDLWTGLRDIIERARPDAVLLETTGIAQPQAIALGCRQVGGLAPRVRTVVDATCAPAQLERHAEARAQVLAADGIVLSKLDLASPEQVLAAHAALDPLAPPHLAERASFPQGDAGSRALAGWLLDALGTRRRSMRASAHQPQLAAVSIFDGPALLEEPLLAAIARMGDTLVRAKGWVRLAGGGQGFLEKAGERVSLRRVEGSGRTELVLIGQGLDEAACTRTIWACGVAGQ
jgi:G3E family GTPase